MEVLLGPMEILLATMEVLFAMINLYFAEFHARQQDNECDLKVCGAYSYISQNNLHVCTH